MKENKITFKTRTIKISNTHYLLLPIEIKEYLDLNTGEEIHMQAEQGKHGKYASVWNPQQKEKR